MPSPSRVLSAAMAADVAAAAFAAPVEQLCGVELEWPVHRADDPLARATAAELAAVAADPLPAAGRVTIEPGGQVELSTRPATTADAALDAAATDSAEVHRRLRTAGLEAAELAFDARRAPERVLASPRYACMGTYFGPGAGAWMMCNTASLQVNVSHDATDTDRRWTLAHRLGPVLVAAFANSPGHDRHGRRWESLRQAVWWAIDPRRTRPVGPQRPAAQGWLDYALAEDVMLIRSADGGTAYPVEPGLPFGRWLADGHPHGWPTADDLRCHLTTLFPPIRPRGWLELRMLDALPPPLRDVATLVVLTALTTDAGPELDRRLPETSGLWLTAARCALSHPVLATAAATLLEVVLVHLDAVTGDPARRDAVAEFADRHVSRGVAPAQLVGDAQLTARLRPDLSGRGPAARATAGACAAAR